MSLLQSSRGVWGSPSADKHSQQQKLAAAEVILGPLLLDWYQFRQNQSKNNQLVSYDDDDDDDDASEFSKESLYASLGSLSLLDNILSTCRSASTAAASDPSTTTNDTSSSSSNNNSKHKQNKSKKKGSSHKRSVSFSDTMHVRTHSIVMGDHPCCRQLALELGWEHDDGSLVDMERYHKVKRSKNNNNNNTNIDIDHNHKKKKLARRRPYLERKSMLKEVGGMTEEDIDQAALRRHHADPTLSAMQRRIRRDDTLLFL
jgi:hypothetical protein